MRFIATMFVAVILPAAASADVLATVDDASLTWEEVLYMIGGEANIPYLGITSEAGAAEVLQSWVREEVLVQAAEAAGMESDPDVAMLLEQARRQILLEAYMADLVSDLQPSRLEVENYVEEWLSTYRKSAHVRHIVLGSRTTAATILARLSTGADFAAMAQEYSIGPSGADGGDLGWITRGQSGYMSFDEAAFSLAPGEISEVVETGAGYHIIKVEDTEPITPEPSVSDIQQVVEMELTQAMQEEAIMAEVEALELNHSVSIYPERLLDHL